MANATPDAQLPVDLGFEQAARAEELRSRRIEVLAEARLKEAKAGSIDEHTLQQRLTNIIKARSLKEYDNQLKRFYAERHQRTVAARWLSDNAAALNRYRAGDGIPDSLRTACWAAYRVFIARAPASVILAWAAMPIDFEMNPKHWIARKTSGTPGDGLPSGLFSVENAAELLDVQNKHYAEVVVKFASPPHIASMKALALLVEHHAQEAAQIEADLKALQDGTYDLWKPQDLLKLTDNAV